MAFGNDELRPLSQKGRDNWGSIAVTLVDSLDTLWLMDMKEEFEEAVRYVAENVTFSSDTTLSVFEFSIRVVGGLLSAYYLSGDDRLVSPLRSAGEVVLNAFDGTHPLPHVCVIMVNEE